MFYGINMFSFANSTILSFAFYISPIFPKIEKINLILTFYAPYVKLNMVYYSAKFLKRVNSMAMNYNKLWKLMIDRNLMKKDLIQMAGISTNAMAKMGKGGDVSTQVLRKICVALNCKIEDIVEITENKSVF